MTASHLLQLCLLVYIRNNEYWVGWVVTNVCMKCVKQLAKNNKRVIHAYGH